MFADTHVHPLMKYIHNDRNDLWDPFFQKLELSALINAVVGIPAYSQADMTTLVRANVQIVFCALHPPEQKIVFHNLQYSRKSGLLEDIAAKAISIPQQKIDFFQTEDYDHFEQLKKEYALLLSQMGLDQNVDRNGKAISAQYMVVKNFGEVKNILKINRNQPNKHIVAVIPTIEGMHSLGIGHVHFKNKPQNPHNVSEEIFLKRLDDIKGAGQNNQDTWISPPIVANLTHAFDNSLCGHAQALSNLFQLLFDYAEPYGPFNGPRQTEGLNKPLSAFGETVILRMLNLDQVSLNRPDPGRRIIPDIKHMSTQTRKRYYEIIDGHNAANPDDVIPVIMSHAAVNGKASLNDHLDPDDSQKEWEESDTFNPGSINLFDDEILKIHKTKGLIGVIMDERILAGGEKLRELKGKIDRDEEEPDDYFKGKNKKRRWATLVLDQVYHIVSTVKNSGVNDWITAWDIICIGSDFDGQINPVDSYSRATDFSKLKNVLKKLINRDNRFDDLFGGHSVDWVLEKICFENVYGFLERNFK